MYEDAFFSPLTKPSDSFKDISAQFVLYILHCEVKNWFTMDNTVFQDSWISISQHFLPSGGALRLRLCELMFREEVRSLLVSNHFPSMPLF